MPVDENTFKNISIDYLDLGLRATNALKKNNILNVHDLLQLTNEEISLLPGVGTTSATQILSLTPADFDAAYDRYQDDLAQVDTPNPLLQIGDPAVFQDISVDLLGLDARSVNALKKNSIYTAYDLAMLSPKELRQLRGIGETSLQNILAVDQAAYQKAYNIHEHIPTPQDDLPCISQYILNGQRAAYHSYLDRNYALFVNYYNNFPHATYESVIPADFSLTKARAQQIISRILSKILDLVKGGLVKTDFLRLATIYAQNVTRLDNVDMSCDDYLNGIALSFIASKIFPEQITIFFSPLLEHSWLIATPDQDHIEESLSALTDLLYNASSEYHLQDLATEFSVNPSLILDIRNIMNRDGLISKKGNRAARGDSPVTIVSNCIESFDRPVSVSEIVTVTGMDDRQVRAAIDRMSDSLNVGPSLYTLRDRKFEDQSVADLAKGYLVAINKPVRLDRLAQYVQSYRDVDTDTLFAIVSDPNSAFLPLNVRGYRTIGLKGVTYEVPKSRNYQIRLDLAIVELFHDIEKPISKDDIAKKLTRKYGNKVSHNINSINNAVFNLLNAEILRKVGNELISKSRTFDENYDQIYRDLLAS